MSHINVIFGTAGHTDPSMGFSEKEAVRQSFDILSKYGIQHLDTAQIYGNGNVEAFLGELTPPGEFEFDTKWPGGFAGESMASSKDRIVSSALRSKEILKAKQIDIFYMHSPDRKTPIEEALKGIQQAYELGVFKRFGLSNFPPAEVEEIYKICQDRRYVSPSVYQGNYSAISRSFEDELFPLLRKLNMSFYAYSPLAGGFLTKTKDQILQGAGRFNERMLGGLYRDMFVKPGFVDSLAKWERIADEEGCTRAELAYRWVAYHSALKQEFGDALIVGANGPAQLEETLRGLEQGHLTSKSVAAIHDIWGEVHQESNSHYF